MSITNYSDQYQRSLKNFIWKKKQMLILIIESNICTYITKLANNRHFVRPHSYRISISIILYCKYISTFVILLKNFQNIIYFPLPIYIHFVTTVE